MRSRDRLLGAGMAVGWGAAQLLPEPAADRLFRAAADRMYRRRGRSVVQLARNLKRVLDAGSTPATPQTLAATVQAGVRSYARYWKETCRLESMDLDAVLHRTLQDTHGLEHVAETRRSGTGLVLALPHCGNWDVAGLIAGRLFGGMTTVTERVRPESLYRRFVGYRESLGMEVVPLTGGDRPVSAVLTERLQAGGIVCLPADRDLSRTGIGVEFFGARTRMPPGPAMLAARTGATLCTLQLDYTHTRDGRPGWHNVVSAPVLLEGTRLREIVTGATQRIADAFARDIATAPADWHMMQPLWDDDLRAGTSAAKGEHR